MNEAVARKRRQKDMWRNISKTGGLHPPHVNPIRVVG